MAKYITITHTTDEGPWTRTWEKRNPQTDLTQKRLDELTTKLHVLYARAADDLMAKQFEWVHKHEARVERYRAEVQAGLLAKSDFDAWMKGQLFQAKAWELKRGQLARLLVDYDRQAAELINGGMVDVFADNANFAVYRIEQKLGVTTAFGLYNRDAVYRLLLDEPDLLPRKEIDDGRDYDWYNRIITEAVLQGILQGETLHEIALRVAEETGEKADSSMLRNARTAYTGAQNAGELQSMRRARDGLGLRIQKRWMATLDNKVRDAHAQLDGQIAEIDEPFDSALGEIMYPGDPEAEPANVYNCRCGMDEFFPDDPDAMDRWDATGEHVGDVTYEEWLEMRGGG